MPSITVRVHICTLFAFFSSSGLAQESKAAHTEQLHAVVSAWLKPNAAESAKDGGLSSPSLTQTERDVMGYLRPAVAPQYHPHSGCVTGSLCYPAPNLFKHLIQFNPGPVVVEYGSYLGEATIGLAQALTDIQGIWGGTLSTKVLAIDSFQNNAGYMGMFQNRASWSAPAAAVTAIGEGNRLPYPMPFYQFLANSAVSASARERVVPFPLLDPSAVMRANALGSADPPTRPRFIYVNPVGASLRHDLPILWHLLACGGTMAGVGYHLADIQPQVDAFDASKPGARLEKFVVHAPGAAKYERLETEFSHEALLANRKSNFSFWRFTNKPCPKASEN
mmetsp:Transcript_2745/g.7621  ORF Transcript_2745/g.7621 Transcript_2745/m.7621 type:complete len:335 (+) Transcript_2745:101-1105(+)|eukprot:CAMPEP_0115848032 /NCGR_PEP_ID=MMETSP0287-20121206/10701_1 /TAXON_ID=412157 /ORGANISM="Chrysochromulina rotalis, Strain UIO044" /LENGTH=334 /DNA_ID=CAMNT_0003301909 /DNA_START=29 /DNA_END=1033 /DNA_ORIENTATION=+